METITHHTAWVTTDPSCLDTDHVDVVVLEDEIGGYIITDDGDEIPQWTSTMNEELKALLPQRHDGDHDGILESASDALDEAGWNTVGEWDGVSTGYTITVTRA